MPLTAAADPYARRRALQRELTDAKAGPITWTQEDAIDRLLAALESVEGEIAAIEKARCSA
jgi:hypothetical protein